METATGIIEIKQADVEANLAASEQNMKSLKRQAADLRDRQLWQAFGTIGYDAYVEWVRQNEVSFIPST